MTILREIIVAGARIRSPSGIAEENLFTGSGSLRGGGLSLFRGRPKGSMGKKGVGAQ